MKACLLAPALVVASGCVLLDSKALEILPAGPLEGDISVRVKVVCPCERVGFWLDGERVAGTFPANTELDLPLALTLSVGTHRLTARSLDGSPVRSAEREVRIRRSEVAVVAVYPPEGRIEPPDPVTRGPFQVELRFERPLSPAKVAAARFSASPPVASAAVLDDGSTLRVVFTQSIRAQGSAWLNVPPDVLETPAYKAGWSFTWSLAPPAPVSVRWLGINDKAGLRIVARGPVTLAVEVESGRWALPWIDVFLWREGTTSPVKLGRILPPAPGLPWSLDWDVSQEDEQTFQVRLTSDPDFAMEAYIWLRVDHTPPGAPTLIPLVSQNVASANECVAVTASEPVEAVEQVELVSDGAPRAVVSTGLGGVICPAPLPLQALTSESSFTFRMRDVAGNVSGPFTRTLATPAWEARWGAGPFEGLPVAEDLFAAWSGASDNTWTFGNPHVLAVGAPGTEQAGALIHWQGLPPFAPPPRVLNQEAGSTVDSAGWAWVERSDSGPGRVYALFPEGGNSVFRGPINHAAGRDARAAAWTFGGSTLLVNLAVAAWSEEAASGRVIAVTDSLGGRAVLERLDPDAVADEPSIWMDRALWIAWVEGPPGGPRHLRVARDIGAGFTSVLENGNLDPREDASEPVLHQLGDTLAVVAWREGGQVLARVKPDAGQPFGPPVVMNADPTRPARSPVLDLTLLEPIVYWIEASAQGDTIRARRWNGSVWELAPHAANEGIPGRVLALDGRGHSVGWIGEGGVIHLRYAACLY